MLSEFIQTEEQWTKGAYARDLNGTPVSPDTDLAVCWCALGLARRDMGEYPRFGSLFFDDWFRYLQKAAFQLKMTTSLEWCTVSVIEVNDSPETTFEKFKEWIALADSLMLKEQNAK